MDLVAVDIGGTHARFALAAWRDGQLSLSHVTKMATSDHASLESAWRNFGAKLDRALPTAASVAVACPVTGDEVKLTNNPWLIRQSALRDGLGLTDLLMLNDFGAVAHAISAIDGTNFTSICGPHTGLPRDGVISVIGPGTGLGVALILRDSDGRATVIETEGGHIGFAAQDAVEIAILERVSVHHRRVSAERVVSGPGLSEIYQALAQMENAAITPLDDMALWTQAIAGSNRLARAAFDRWCMALGAAVGDIALAQGAKAVVLAGGIIPRFIDQFRTSGFSQRFTAKGRFVALMQTLPVYLCTHPFPGLFGAGVAFGHAQCRAMKATVR